MAAEIENKLDYAAFLADLEAKRSVLDHAIASVRAVMAVGALAANVGGPLVPLVDLMRTRTGGEIPDGAFNSKSIPEATKIYLSIVKTKRTTKEIADALREGGMETSGKNFEVIVGSALYRVSKKPGEIVRVKGAWGLAEWWPAGVRASQEKGNGRKSRRSRPKSTKTAKATIVSAAPHAEANGHNKPQARIAELLRNNPTKVYSWAEISDGLGIDARTVALALGRLAAKNLAQKVERGKYCATHN